MIPLVGGGAGSGQLEWLDAVSPSSPRVSNTRLNSESTTADLSIPPRFDLDGE
jgi:hypothetical protein